MQLKRQPLTPSPSRKHVEKKMKEYVSPMRPPTLKVATPLRNVTSADQVEQPIALPTSPLVLTPKAPVVKKIDLKSPALGISPRAHPPTLQSPLALGESPLAKGRLIPVATKKTQTSAKPPNPTLEQMNSAFEEWMRIAADNKINSKNTWNFALIDYFSELTFLRDGDSINFQKASCTLDGCVKIYSSRVDSVAEQTGKLLTGLISDKEDALSLLKGTKDEKDGTPTQKIATRRHRTVVETLEKNMENLSLKQIDQECTADPLFRKMCAQFDELGGMPGMLQTSLPLNPNDLSLIFDDYQSPNSITLERQTKTAVATDEILKAIDESLMNLMAIRDASISPTFSNFEIDATSGVSFEVTLPETSHQPQENPFGVQEYEETVIPMVMEDDYDYGADLDNQWKQQDAVQEAITKAAANLVIEDEEEIEVEETEYASAEAQNYLSHMDEKIGQNWAGPQHWKIRRIGPSFSVKPKIQAPSQIKQKNTSVIDFNTANPDILSLFTKSSNAGTITLGKGVIVDRANTNFLLPEDIHFSSIDLLKLFTKPNYKLGQSQRIKVKQRASSAPHEEPDIRDGAEFWAQQEPALPVNDVDEPDAAMNNLSNDDGFDYEDIIPSNLVPSVIIPEHPQVLNYAHKARRINVQLLKERMWGNISSNTQKFRSPVSFDSVIQSTSDAFQKDTKLTVEEKDLSTAYCFICLLHLANENNLELIASKEVNRPEELMIVKH